MALKNLVMWTEKDINEETRYAIRNVSTGCGSGCAGGGCATSGCVACGSMYNFKRAASGKTKKEK